MKKSFSDLSIGDGGAPNLQALVEKYGGYDKIPGDEWLRYDDELNHAHHRLAHLHKRIKEKKE